MKTIKCDICWIELGKELSRAEYGGWSSITTTQYQPSGFYVDTAEPKINDMCLDCWNHIAKAQNEAIKQLKPSQ